MATGVSAPAGAATAEAAADTPAAASGASEVGDTAAAGTDAADSAVAAAAGTAAGAAAGASATDTAPVAATGVAAPAAFGASGHAAPPGVRGNPCRIRSEEKVDNGYAFSFSISSINAGTTVNTSPTTPKSAISKIGASASLLIAIMNFDVCMPALC